LYILNFKLELCLDKFNIGILVEKYDYDVTILKLLRIMCSLSNHEDNKKTIKKSGINIFTTLNASHINTKQIIVKNCK